MKVKAHLTEEQSKAIDQHDLWHGNDVADSAAKDRAEKALPPEAICKSLDETAAARASFYRGAAKLLAAYPRPAALVEPSRSQAMEQVTLTEFVLYRGRELAWAEHVGRYVCLACSSSCRAERLKDVMKQE